MKKIILISLLLVLLVGCINITQQQAVSLGNQSEVKVPEKKVVTVYETNEEPTEEQKVTEIKTDCRIATYNTILERCFSSAGDPYLFRGHIVVTNWGDDGYCVLKIKYGYEDTISDRKFLANDESYTYEWDIRPEDWCDWSTNKQVNDNYSNYLTPEYTKEGYFAGIKAEYLKEISKDYFGKTLMLEVS